jgi:hypothetical protein
MYTIGIDCGLEGSVAILGADGGLVGLYDTPTLVLRTSRGTKREFDCPGMAAILVPFAGPQSHTILEEAQAMPHQGTRSMFTVGVGFGLWLGTLAALRMPYSRVRPHTWKRALALGKDKEQSRLRAQQLFPDADLRRRKDHGRAEALLLAHYGLHHQKG